MDSHLRDAVRWRADDAENLALACSGCNLRKGPHLTGLILRLATPFACFIRAVIAGQRTSRGRAPKSSGKRQWAAQPFSF